MENRLRVLQLELLHSIFPNSTAVYPLQTSDSSVERHNADITNS